MFTRPASELPRVLQGFESINRYWDRTHAIPAAKILPGEYYVTANDELITTVLGSCVSACIRDRVFGIGGMNHFMLPASDNGGWGSGNDIASTANRYGNYAMEHMINDILKNGGHRRNLEVKIFGGGRIIHTGTDVGNNNIDFVRSYIKTEGLTLVSEDVGDIYPRKIVYFPATGRVRVKKLKNMHNDTVVRREREYQKNILDVPVAGEIELF
jgi:chemotaxis protein CheD